MSSRIACWLHGHPWGPWKRGWQAGYLLLGEPDPNGQRFMVSFCEQCGAKRSKPE